MNAWKLQRSSWLQASHRAVIPEAGPVHADDRNSDVYRPGCPGSSNPRLTTWNAIVPNQNGTAYLIPNHLPEHMQLFTGES
jgi:hypothetical protein